MITGGLGHGFSKKPLSNQHRPLALGNQMVNLAIVYMISMNFAVRKNSKSCNQEEASSKTHFLLRFHWKVSHNGDYVLFCNN